jgi:hypothetical protein
MLFKVGACTGSNRTHQTQANISDPAGRFGIFEIAADACSGSC